MDVPYSFHMADARITTTIGFAAGKANAEIVCGKCGHTVVIKGGDFARMFSKPVPLEWARYRLKCKSCRSKAAMVTPVYEAPR
jgi:DNA-directed RNA polymerase subunit RPC12/RpoP